MFTERWWFRWSLVFIYLVTVATPTVFVRFPQFSHQVITGAGDFLCRALDPVAVFTLVLGIATIRLWSATERLQKGSEKSSERQLRAYISVPHRLLTVDPAQTEITVALKIRNSGQTPAYKFRIAWDIWFDDFPEPQINPVSEDDDDESYLGPSDEISSYASVSLPQTEIPGLIAERRAVWVSGVVTYQDAFEVARETRFRFYMSGTAYNGPDPKMFVASVGNLAT